MAKHLAERVLEHARANAELANPRSDEPSCGPECLYYFLRICRQDISPVGVLDAFDKVADGVSMLEIKQAGLKFGLGLRGLHGRSGSLLKLTTPAILAVHNAHFVTLAGVYDGRLVIIDPPYSVRLVLPAEFEEQWSGYALVLEEER